MLRAYAPPVRLVALFMGMLAMLAATIVFAGPTRAQTIGDVPVTGDVFNKKGKDVGDFTGTITDPHVSYVKTPSYKGLMLSGTLEDGKVTTSDGTMTVPSKEFKTKAKVGTQPRTSAAGVSQQQAETCPILHLTTGAIDLNLLGLKVHLDPILLDITAVSGPGNLLGNLLCALVHLLDNTTASNALANLLNAILELLASLGLL